jgi:purine-binding chemotaxis protein CheW
VALIFDQADIVQLVGFRVGPKLFGTSIQIVSEILLNPVIDAVAGAPSFIKGVVRLRGAVAPIVDLSALLSLPASESAPEKIWLLIVQAGKNKVGFIVDSVTPIIRIKDNTILPPPDLIRSGKRSKYIQGVAETENGLLVIVNLDHMLLDEEIKAMEQMNVD